MISRGSREGRSSGIIARRHPEMMLFAYSRQVAACQLVAYSSFVDICPDSVPSISGQIAPWSTRRQPAKQPPNFTFARRAISGWPTIPHVAESLDERPPDRLRRPRARAGLEARRFADARPSCTPRPAIPASASRPRSSRSTWPIMRRSPRSAGSKAIGLVVVGPGGAAGRRASPTTCAAAGIRVFGPSQAAARLEGSKGFTKDLCADSAFRPPPMAASPIARGGQGLCPRAGRADRRQGRRPRGGQGRHRRR